LPGMTDKKVGSKLLQNYSEGLWMNRRLTEGCGNDPSLPQLEMSEGAVFYLFVVYLTTPFVTNIISVEWKGNKRTMNWKTFGRKRSRPNFKPLSLYSPGGTEKTYQKLQSG
jgi:hypothetical protein